MTTKCDIKCLSNSRLNPENGRPIVFNTISRKTLVVIWKYHFELEGMVHVSSFSNFELCIGRPLPSALCLGGVGSLHPEVKGINIRTPRKYWPEAIYTRAVYPHNWNESPQIALDTMLGATHK